MYKISFILIFYIVFFNTSAQFHFKNKNRNHITFPIDIINNLIVIKLQINNSDTLRFLLDTGVKTTILTETFPENNISIRYNGYVNILGLGGSDTIKAKLSSNNQISLPGIEGIHINILSIVGHQITLSPSLGIRINGLVGYDLLKDFVVKINYHNQRISFYKHAFFYKRQNKYKKWNSLDISIENYKPYIQTLIQQVDNSTLNVKLLIDIGGGHNIALYTFSNDKIILPQNKINAFLGFGLVGDLEGYISRIKTFNIAGYNFKNVVTDFPDQLSVFSAIDHNRNGSIGGGLTRRFKLILDYAGKKIYLKKNHYFKMPFTLNQSGIVLKKQLTMPPVYYISYITKNSPAEKAGLFKNDYILEINNHETFTLSFSEIYKILKRKNKKVNLTILRDGTLLKKRIILNAFTL